MGVIKRGVLGGFSGRVANIVGSSWKGIAVMKSLPLSVANPRTPGQVNQRNRFSAATIAGSEMLSTICKPLWDRFAQQQSGFNAFVQANVPNFDDSGILTTGALELSRGALTGIVITGVTVSAATKIVQVSYTNNNGVGNALANDATYFGVTVGIVQEFEGFADVTDRTVNVAGFSLEQDFIAGDFVQVYGAIRRADGTLVSGTSYFGAVATA